MIVRLTFITLVCALLGGCIVGGTSTEHADLGDFVLKQTVIVADDVQVGPLSRIAEPQEWEVALEEALTTRFDAYTGQTPYSIGVSVVGYTLAPPGVPLVFSPKSILVISVNLWGNESPDPLNAELEDFFVFEDLSPDTLIGSGLTRTKEEQIEVLARNAAISIEGWIAENPQWLKRRVLVAQTEVADPEAEPENVTLTAEATALASQDTNAPLESLTASLVPRAGQTEATAQESQISVDHPAASAPNAPLAPRWLGKDAAQNPLGALKF